MKNRIGSLPDDVAAQQKIEPAPGTWTMTTRVRQQGTERIAMTMFMLEPTPKDGRVIYSSDEHLAKRILRYLNLSEATADDA